MPEQKQTFQVEGMTCTSCVLLLEEKLKGQAGVRGVTADLSTYQVTVTGKLADEPEVLASKLTQVIEKNGYKLSLERGSAKNHKRDFLIAIPAALTVIIGFILLQKLGLVNLVTASEVSFGTAALLGLIASVSTCLAVVGGLVLSLSATAAKNRAHWQSQSMFHVGRLGGFFVLGGLIGSAGKLFELGLVGGGILSILVAVVMLILGVNLLDLSSKLKRFQIRMPSVLARQTVKFSSSTHMLAPLMVGIGTFFLPCGFTQSMQVYTLTTGSFLTGGLTMLFFALGTLPVLGLLSFGALEISDKPWKGVFFKASGIVIIALALFNVWNALDVLNLV